jgi:uncharacterized DUF497 family protein
VIQFVWNEEKRLANLLKHGLDFADAEKVFNNPLVVFEDSRAAYGEQRMIAMGMLQALIVVIVHVDENDIIRIISMRKATRNETDIYYRNCQ